MNLRTVNLRNNRKNVSSALSGKGYRYQRRRVKAIIVPGWGCNGRRYSSLTSELSKYGIPSCVVPIKEFVAPGKRTTLDPNEWRDDVFGSVMRYVENAKKSGFAPLLIGHSCGGIVASILGKKHNIPFALIAPAIPYPVKAFPRNSKFYLSSAIASFLVNLSVGLFNRRHFKSSAFVMRFGISLFSVLNPIYLRIVGCEKKHIKPMEDFWKHLKTLDPLDLALALSSYRRMGEIFLEYINPGLAIAHISMSSDPLVRTHLGSTVVSGSHFSFDEAVNILYTSLSRVY